MNVMRDAASASSVRRRIRSLCMAAVALTTITIGFERGAAQAASGADGVAGADETAVIADDSAPTADLAISMTSNTPGPFVDHSFTWTLSVTNNGPGSAGSVTVSDAVPAAVDVLRVTSDDFGCVAVGNSVTCTRPELAAGASGSIVIDVMVPNSFSPQVINNVANVASLTTDPVPTNNTASSSVLTVVVLVGGPPVAPATDPNTPPTLVPADPVETTEPATASSEPPPPASTEYTDGIASQPSFNDRLPETGTSSQPLWLVAAEALLLGVALVAVSRRRRHSA